MSAYLCFSVNMIKQSCTHTYTYICIRDLYVQQIRKKWSSQCLSDMRFRWSLRYRHPLSPSFNMEIEKHKSEAHPFLMFSFLLSFVFHKETVIRGYLLLCRKINTRIRDYCTTISQKTDNASVPLELYLRRRISPATRRTTLIKRVRYFNALIA